MTPSDNDETTSGITISVDAMGGDLGPSAVVDGLSKAAEAAPDVRFILHGREHVLVAERTPCSLVGVKLAEFLFGYYAAQQLAPIPYQRQHG